MGYGPVDTEALGSFGTEEEDFDEDKIGDDADVFAGMDIDDLDMNVELPDLDDLDPVDE